MTRVIDVWRRLWSLRERRLLERRLDAELNFHIDQQVDKNRRAGMTPDEARRSALVKFGGSVAVLVLIAAAVASFVPARRTLRVHPTDALRAE